MMTPSELVAVMNGYLTEMTNIIEQHGGFVDKYIGDGIVAAFGAPHEDADHAVNAVSAALACRARLDELNHTTAAFRGKRLGCRIGLNSGEALVGNIGSQRRFNYTVMGDTVNLASRLEGANKHFATTIIASRSDRLALCKGLLLARARYRPRQGPRSAREHFRAPGPDRTGKCGPEGTGRHLRARRLRAGARATSPARPGMWRAARHPIRRPRCC